MNSESLNRYNLFLIGFRCTGKSSVGRRLAASLNWPFLDTDDMLVAEAGMSIKEIVAKHGWPGLRSMERAVVNRACTPDQQVVATGGGVVLDPENVNRMKGSGKLIWLQASPETIKNRMMRDSGTDAFRPALTLKDSNTEVEESLVERDPLYRLAADVRMATDACRIEEICDAIIEKLRQSRFFENHQ